VNNSFALPGAVCLIPRRKDSLLVFPQAKPGCKGLHKLAPPHF
jgi:hypothetical protein